MSWLIFLGKIDLSNRVDDFVSIFSISAHVLCGIGLPEKVILHEEI